MNQPLPGVGAQPLVGSPSPLPGITAVNKTQYLAPSILISGREKDGKSSLTTTLFGFPGPQHQPLVLAVDPSGPDSCINLGYAIHAIKVNEQPGSRWFDRIRSATDVIEKNIATIRTNYGSIVFDDLSTASYRMLEDARRGSKNPDPRSHYQTMYTQVNELWWRLHDLEMPLVWLAWMGEPSTNDDGVRETAAPDIAGKRFARTIAGRSQHVFLLEKRKVGIGAAGADKHGYARLLHTIPWNGQNAGGRFSHLLPEPMPADLGLIMRTVRGDSP
jgi:hypothetical protein